MGTVTLGQAWLELPEASIIALMMNLPFGDWRDAPLVVDSY